MGAVRHLNQRVHRHDAGVSAIADRRWRGREVVAMQWDLGVQGIAVLALLSLAFGLFTQVAFRGHGGRGLWLATSVAMFLVGLLVSEGAFGWATEEDLQPNIDGLSLDEVLVTFLVAIIVVLVARAVVWKRDQPPRSI
jgi:hypothetical protein